jgi:hypothetical protein
LPARSSAAVCSGSHDAIETIADAAEAVDADVVVVAATLPERIEAARVWLAALATGRRVALPGPGARADVAAAIGVEHLDGDPVAAAAVVAGRAPRPR